MFAQRMVARQSVIQFQLATDYVFVIFIFSCLYFSKKTVSNFQLSGQSIFKTLVTSLILQTLFPSYEFLITCMLLLFSC